jgi:hypothetical protein
MKILHRSKELKEIFPTPPSVAYSRDKNLHEIIIHKKNTIICFTRNRIYVNIAVKTVCFVNISSEAIHFFGTDGKEYQVKGYINCKTLL